MINQLFTFSSAIERLRQGPLSEHLDAYAAAIAAQGYGRHSIREQIVVIADFSRWLKQKQIDVQALESEVVDRFLRLRRRQQRIRRGDPKALQRLLTMLCQKGVVKPRKPPVADNAQARLVAEFQRYLLQERGLSPLTLRNYVPVVEQFLAERFQNRAPNFAKLRAPHVTGFVMRHAHQLSPVRAGLMVTALRSFFRYLRHRGAIVTDLADCVPTVQLVAFHASEVPSGCHGRTYSGVLRSNHVRRQAEPCDLAAARQARRTRRRSRWAELRRYRLEHGSDYHSRKGREIGPTAVARRRGHGPCRLFA